MTRAALLALAERVEMAEASDDTAGKIHLLALDRAICIEALGWTPCTPSDVSWLMRPDGSTCLLSATPRFTASLDAALTLVPEGMCWSVTRKESGLHVACVWRGPACCCRATYTPALALTAAALRARAEGGSDE